MYISVNMPKLLLRFRKERFFFFSPFFYPLIAAIKFFANAISSLSANHLTPSYNEFFLHGRPPPLTSGLKLQIHIPRSSAAYLRCRRDASAAEDDHDPNEIWESYTGLSYEI